MLGAGSVLCLAGTQAEPSGSNVTVYKDPT
jgi:hypothetical protein